MNSRIQCVASFFIHSRMVIHIALLALLSVAHVAFAYNTSLFLQWEGGTNDVRSGLRHTFSGLQDESHVFIKVQIAKTDYNNASSEFVDFIGVNNHKLSDYCFPGVEDVDEFFVCLFDNDVTSHVNADGDLNLFISATIKVNTYDYLGFLLYAKVTITGVEFPTGQPTLQPSMQPTGQPSGQPTSQPSSQPASSPTTQPTSQPTGIPTCQPTGEPTGVPSSQPTGMPSAQPSSTPTTSYPTSLPSHNPTVPFIWEGGSGLWNNRW